MALFDKPAHVLHDMLVKKEISAQELTADVLGRLDAVEGDVQAYITTTREQAEEQAKAADEKIARGEKISSSQASRAPSRIISAPRA